VLSLLSLSAFCASGPLSQDVYLWQRSWNEPTLAAVVQHSTNFSEIAALNAEVTWTSGQARVIRVLLNYGALRLGHQPVGIVLRVGPFSGPFAVDDKPATALTGLARALVAEAASNHLDLAELQLDFDCAESKLDGYRCWVDAIRGAISPVPLVITALPAWLGQPAFRDLAEHADGVVLQVHSLERPRSPEAAFTLCEPEAARRAVTRMAEFGRPFRVALATYGYTIAFSADGKFLGLSAEGPASTWPTGAQTRDVRSDPSATAGLVRQWTASRSEFMRGVIWYRLPVAGDRLNWTWPTLDAVMAGRTPSARLRAGARQPEPGLVEIEILNDGDGEYSGPASVKATWSPGRLLASDALNGFGKFEVGTNFMIFQRADQAVKLGPGQRSTIGWMRVEECTGVQIDLLESK
jgi:hypothetical protein